MECKFKVGDKVILGMNSVPRSVETVVSVSGTKRINVRITGDEHAFDELGHMRGGSLCSWYIRSPKDGEVAKIELIQLRQRMGNINWFKVPESKLRRIAAIIDGGE